MIKSDDFCKNCLQTFQEVTKKPAPFLQTNGDFCEELKRNLKEIYDYTKRQEIKVARTSALPELITQNFDLEQIWQQIDLQNETLISSSLTTVSRLVVNKSGLLAESKESKEEEAQHESPVEASSEESDEDVDLDDIKSDDDDDKPVAKKPEKGRASLVDDEFFKLSEMEKFLQAEEKKTNPDSGNDSEESDEDEASVDLFEEGNDSGDDIETARYKDFFVSQDEKKVAPNKHLRELEEEEEEEEEEEIDETPSSHERKQDRLSRKIEELEEEALEEKPWQLKGEISATNRPQNSLLQEVVEFDLTTRPAPVITEQTTMQLEDIIKQRIKDRVFDSVERKIKPVDTPLEYKKKLVLDQEKSKESLAQIYEKEFLEQQASLSKDEETETKEPELHLEINTLMKSLFAKLDALSNFHFTPKPAIPELKIVSNLPAINMEEVAPVATSDATLLAPQEIKKTAKGDIVGKAERTSTDKKRERRKKKLKQKIHAKEKQRQTTVPNKKYSKEKTKKMVEKVSKESNVKKMVNDAKAVKSSKAFFTQLEEQVKSQIKRKTDGTKKSVNTPSAKKLKL